MQPKTGQIWWTKLWAQKENNSQNAQVEAEDGNSGKKSVFESKVDFKLFSTIRMFVITKPPRTRLPLWKTGTRKRITNKVQQDLHDRRSTEGAKKDKWKKISRARDRGEGKGRWAISILRAYFDEEERKREEERVRWREEKKVMKKNKRKNKIVRSIELAKQKMNFLLSNTWKDVASVGERLVFDVKRASKTKKKNGLRFD